MKNLFGPDGVIRKNMAALVGVCLLFYFSYHLIQGDRSYARLLSLNQQISKLHSEQVLLEAEREKLETRVAMLRPNSVNKDLLEERVRFVLGYRHPDEIDMYGEWRGIKTISQPKIQDSDDNHRTIEEQIQ